MSKAGRQLVSDRLSIVGAELRDAVGTLRSTQAKLADAERRVVLLTQIACVALKKSGVRRMKIGDEDIRETLLDCGMRLQVSYETRGEARGAGAYCVVELGTLTQDERVAQDEALARMDEVGKRPEGPGEAPILKIAPGG